MTDTMTEASIFERITRGEFDTQLPPLFEALRQRRKYIAAQQGLQNAASMLPGDAVVISGSISPKYLVGVTGKVSTLPPPKPGFIQVDIDPGQDTGRFRATSLGVPAGCLTKI